MRSPSARGVSTAALRSGDAAAVAGSSRAKRAKSFTPFGKPMSSEKTAADARECATGAPSGSRPGPFPSKKSTCGSPTSSGCASPRVTAAATASSFRRQSATTCGNRASSARVACPRLRHSNKAKNACAPASQARRAIQRFDVNGFDALGSSSVGTDRSARGRATSDFWTWPRTPWPSSHFFVMLVRSDFMCAARARACSFVSTQTGATSDAPASPPASSAAMRRCSHLWQ
mmetsp:Transcript_2732/g.8211  ORF Transcript_2732/g.8211 Transcript_2732/m.8211 type:complete len:231 (-) Transcript_2732:171-863(-)